MSNVYGMKVAVDEMMNEGKSLIDYALKQSMSLDYLGRLDQDDLKAMASLKSMSEAVQKFINSEVSAIESMYESQKEINRKLDEINRKLDKLNKDE